MNKLIKKIFPKYRSRADLEKEIAFLQGVNTMRGGTIEANRDVIQLTSTAEMDVYGETPPLYCRWRNMKMLKDGFLRFCDDPEISCCRGEAELGLLREENVRLRAQLAVRDAEIDRLTEALEIAKRGHVDCMSAERQADGKCLGYGRGENDDEPCAQCSNCPQCTAYEPERKPINEWAALDGICVLDPDGFDRSDPYVLEREITKAEYLAGIWRCTVMSLPAAPEEGE